jgi:hypothetical protein
MKSPYNVCLYILLTILLTCPRLWAQDFGLILDQTAAGYGGSQGDGKFDYEGTLIPRYSTFLGDNGELYISAGLKVESLNGTTTVLPEILRTEFSWYFDIGDIKAGRMYYSAPLPFIAEGLFDGASFTFDTAMGNVGIGAWYTGLLYKKRINITMTLDELLSYYSALDYGNFANTYFATQRFITAVDWEYPDLLDLIRVKLALLGQFDLSGGKLNSQYLAAQFAMPLKAFVIDLGGCLEMIQHADDSGVAFAGELSFSWMLPEFAVFTQSQLTLLGRFSSGTVKDSAVRAFQPVTSMDQGEVIKKKLSDLSMISLDYTARFNRNISAGLSTSFFSNREGSFLGNEFFGRFYWSPTSDLWLNLGCGAFIPYKEYTGNVWRLELNAVLSVY